jgi:hypothetical protein
MESDDGCANCWQTNMKYVEGSKTVCTKLSESGILPTGIMILTMGAHILIHPDFLTGESFDDSAPEKKAPSNP